VQKSLTAKENKRELELLQLIFIFRSLIKRRTEITLAMEEKMRQSITLKDSFRIGLTTLHSGGTESNFSKKTG